MGNVSEQGVMFIHNRQGNKLLASHHEHSLLLAFIDINTYNFCFHDFRELCCGISEDKISG